MPPDSSTKLNNKLARRAILRVVPVQIASTFRATFGASRKCSNESRRSRNRPQSSLCDSRGQVVRPRFKRSTQRLRRVVSRRGASGNDVVDQPFDSRQVDASAQPREEYSGILLNIIENRARVYFGAPICQKKFVASLCGKGRANFVVCLHKPKSGGRAESKDYRDASA